jgi:hypothetical protein
MDNGVRRHDLEVAFAALVRQLTDGQKRTVLLCLWAARSTPPPPNEQQRKWWIVDATGGKHTL